jgi:putative peptide zinc metalloprotease protein
MALTVPVILAMPGAASAAVNDNSPAVTQTYDNQAQASSQTNRWTDLSVKYQFEQTSAGTVTGDNSADASTSYCHDCGAVAIGFQVLVVSLQHLATLHVSNLAYALSYYCTRCNTHADAYQIVFAAESPQLTLSQILGLASIGQKLQVLQYSGLSMARVRQLAAEFAQQAVLILQQGIGTHQGGDGPEYSPALHGAGLPAAMAENSGPVIDLYVQHKSANG